MKTPHKKLILICSLLLAISTPLLSISLSTYATLESRKGGGGVEIGYPLLKKESFHLQHHAAINFYLGDSVDLKGHFLSLSNKIVFAHADGSMYKTYGFARLEGGYYYDSNSSLFDPPFILEIGGGAGFEFLFSEKKAFFSEFGGGTTFRIPKDVPTSNSDFSGSYVLITIGIRNYFE